MSALLAVIALSVASAAPIYAVHDGRVDGRSVVWRSTIDVGGEGDLPLRRPLPADVVVVAEGARPVRDGAGRTVALSVAARVDQLVVVTTQPWREGSALTPPLVPCIERIRFTDGRRFLVDEASGIERRIGWQQAPDVSARERDELDDRFGAAHPNAAPIWLGDKTPPRIVAEGLIGAMAEPGAGRAGVAAAALALALCAVAALALGFKALARRAALERVERVLDEEWRVLAKDATRPPP